MFSRDLSNIFLIKGFTERLPTDNCRRFYEDHKTVVESLNREISQLIWTANELITFYIENIGL